jgi:hypothetical protein
LLEVLAAMLVLTVGILAMARLIPVGVYELSEANKLDQASTLGRASFRDLEVRGLLNPNEWFDPALGQLIDQTTGLQAISYNWLPTSRPNPWAVAGNSLPFPSAVVIDPLMVSSPDGLAAPTKVQTFPYNISPGGGSDTLNASAPWIPRVNVMVPNGVGAFVPMAFQQADRVFRSSDERSYTDPATVAAAGNMRPTMVYNYDSSANRVQSSTLGNDSWFITVFPSAAEAKYAASNFTASTPVSTARQYKVSVVVCNKRDFTLPLGATGTNSPPPGERMLTVTTQAGSVGGGDVVLTAPSNALPDWINVRPGQWILLTCYVGPAVIPPAGQLFADWYRIVSVGDVAGSPATRFVTLQGADWPLTQVYTKIVSGVPVPTTLLTEINAVGGTAPLVFATVVEGVTGVYQKTITLDGNSSWAQ